MTSSVRGFCTRVNGDGTQIIGTVWHHATWSVALAVAPSIVASAGLLIKMLDVPAARGLPGATL